jgi:ribosomal protein S18 acetylase RimI-like enzyme
MEVKPLLDVELREALGPINRAASGKSPHAVRTVAAIRESIALGIVDAKLSRCGFLGDSLVGTCLIERVGTEAQLDAVAVESLAIQRGGGRILLESACAAAKAAGVTRITAIVSDQDTSSQGLLAATGFTRGQTVVRYELRPHAISQAPATPLPEYLAERPLPDDAAAGQHFVKIATAAEVLELAGQGSPPETFFWRKEVLAKLAPRLTALVLVEAGENGAIRKTLGAVLVDGERHLLMAAFGEAAELAALCSVAARRHNATVVDALPEDHPAAAALTAAGFERASVRAELVRTF